MRFSRVGGPALVILSFLLLPLLSRADDAPALPTATGPLAAEAPDPIGPSIAPPDTDIQPLDTQLLDDADLWGETDTGGFSDVLETTDAPPAVP